MKTLRGRVIFLVLAFVAVLAPSVVLLPVSPARHATTLIAANSPYPPPPS